jgi:hypothetical protein
MTAPPPVLFEPASAVAVGLCLTARTIAEGRTFRHPRPCGWCDYAIDDLRSMLDGFNAWADRDERTGAYRRFDAAAFQGLPGRQQAALVLEAQAFPDEPPPTIRMVEALEAVPAGPAHDDEEGPTWKQA